VELDVQRPFGVEERPQVRLLTPARLSVAIVAYRTGADTLSRCLASLGESARLAKASGALAAIDLYLIDNGAPGEPSFAEPTLASWPRELGTPRVRIGHGNLGYGSANNLVLAEIASDFHLVMNPDVEIEADALPAVLAAFEAHPRVGLVAPAVFGTDGARQYLCKRYPTLWVLFLRGFAPAFIRRMFAGSLERYEMRDAIADRFLTGVPLASGCFMAIRTPHLRHLRGFDPGYFMYFEDYDLSLRLAREGELAYVPAARIVHQGGDASAKGGRHVLWFMRSARRFFSRHGWKLV
jgi:GT2 family glycosyltransferase